MVKLASDQMYNTLIDKNTYEEFLFDFLTKVKAKTQKHRNIC